MQPLMQNELKQALLFLLSHGCTTPVRTNHLVLYPQRSIWKQEENFVFMRGEQYLASSPWKFTVTVQLVPPSLVRVLPAPLLKNLKVTKRGRNQYTNAIPNHKEIGLISNDDKLEDAPPPKRARSTTFSINDNTEGNKHIQISSNIPIVAQKLPAPESSLATPKRQVGVRVPSAVTPVHTFSPRLSRGNRQGSRVAGVAPQSAPLLAHVKVLCCCALNNIAHILCYPVYSSSALISQNGFTYLFFCQVHSKLSLHFSVQLSNKKTGTIRNCSPATRFAIRHHTSSCHRSNERLYSSSHWPLSQDSRPGYWKTGQNRSCCPSCNFARKSRRW